MGKYYINEYIRIGKRIHNSKRKYIIVNLLQGKHVPVSPKKSLELMNKLGEKLCKKYSEKNLVIAFAETATAIGGEIANFVSDNCFFIHTTREKYDYDSLNFSEEHSHASTHYLYYENFVKHLKDINNIIIVDDEISTGKTVTNLIEALIKKFEIVKNKRIVIASIINRMSKKTIKELRYFGIEIEYLIHIESNFDIEKVIANLSVDEGTIIKKDSNHNRHIYEEKIKLLNPRTGVIINSYIGLIDDNIKKIIEKYDTIFKNSRIVSVIGTEECMLPAILLGKEIENKYKLSVYTHSTTRSPIGVSNDSGYPITKGYKLKSFYDENRITYLYNCIESDVLIVINDSKSSKNAINELLSIHEYNKIKSIIYISE